jgi:hypothetical protein
MERTWGHLLTGFSSREPQCDDPTQIHDVNGAAPGSGQRQMIPKIWRNLGVRDRPLSPKDIGSCDTMQSLRSTGSWAH